SLQLVLGVAITTVGWVSVTFLTRPTAPATLQSFYDRIHPFAYGWRRAVQTRPDDDSLTAALASWFLGCVVVYGALIGTGFGVYGQMGLAALCLSVAAAAALGLFRTVARVKFE
ncbi:MAG: sodium:proline symporter, partial [Gemmatimonadota bacterium]|nr:sodium:proline symporter [Gemmatimonadota bacterium]